jgi:hypothetical protein
VNGFDRWLLDEYLRVTAGLTPDELGARLARRRKATLADPPRAWCLAVRASDTRITPMNAAIWPRHAVVPDEDGRVGEHSVVLDAALLRELCRPVILRPYTDWLMVAKELGVHCESLRYAMRKGFFRVKYIHGAGGRKGPPIPHLYTEETLDPSSGNLHRASDALWGAVWQWAAGSLPAGLEQTVTRRPNYRAYRGGERFRGWYWACPGCGRDARTLFYPLPRYTIPKYLGNDLSAHEADAAPESPGTFACLFCHRVKYFTRLDSGAWNYFVAHVTGGMVYGREVKRPAALAEAAVAKVGRQRRPVHGPDSAKRCATEARRARVLAGLLRGDTYAAIAAEVGVAYATVAGHVCKIYRAHRVRSRRELAALLGPQSVVKAGSLERRGALRAG